MQWHLGIANQLWQSATRSCLFCCQVTPCVPQRPQSVGQKHDIESEEYFPSWRKGHATEMIESIQTKSQYTEHEGERRDVHTTGIGLYIWFDRTVISLKS